MSFPQVNESGRKRTSRRPWVHFHCDIPSDPLLFMQNYNKTYGRSGTNSSFHCKLGAASRILVALILTDALPGFTISLYEFQATIPSLWETVKGMSALHLRVRT